MNKLFLYIVLFFSTVSYHVYSNSQSDSLRLVWQNEELLDSTRFDALDEYYDLYVHVVPDSVLSSLNFYYDLALEKKAERQIYRALLRQGNIYRNQNKKEEAISKYILARNIGFLALQNLLDYVSFFYFLYFFNKIIFFINLNRF